MSVVFTDNCIKVKNAIADEIKAVLEEVAGELESQVKRNTKVKTEKTKGSWQHMVYQTESGFEATVGSNYENAIWEEFGTGEYALKGNGRKGGWVYKDEKGYWHKTFGKKPRRALFKAYSSLKSQIISHIQSKFGSD